MTVCTSCGNNAPDDMRHCSQCGARLPEPEPEAPGKTGHFGDQDIKNLMSKMERENAAPEGGGNLLAGLPRPKVGSMLSPLRGGQTSPTSRKPEKRARSASGSTVMGMPLFSTGEQRAVPMPRPRARPSAVDEAPVEAGTPITGGPSIQSLDSFKDDVDTAADLTADDPAVEPTPTADHAPSAPASADTPPSADPPRSEHRSPSSTDAQPGDPDEKLPDLPAVDALDITSPARPTEQAPAVQSAGGGNIAIAVIILAAVVAGVAFFLLK